MHVSCIFVFSSKRKKKSTKQYLLTSIGALSIAVARVLGVVWWVEVKHGLLVHLNQTLVLLLIPVWREQKVTAS